MNNAQTIRERMNAYRKARFLRMKELAERARELGMLGVAKKAKPPAWSVAAAVGIVAGFFVGAAYRR